MDKKFKKIKIRKQEQALEEKSLTFKEIESKAKETCEKRINKNLKATIWWNRNVRAAMKEKNEAWTKYVQNIIASQDHKNTIA